MAPGPPHQASVVAKFTEHAQNLSLGFHDDGDGFEKGFAAEARFVTPQDPVIKTRDGGRLPTVPLKEALELNNLKDSVERGKASSKGINHKPGKTGHEETLDGVVQDGPLRQSTQSGASFRSSIPPARTNPLFPELPLYGPPSWARNVQCFIFQCSSAVLSVTFLMTIVLGSAFTSIPLMFRHIGMRLRLEDPRSQRPFHAEEIRRETVRKEEARRWEAEKDSKSRCDGARSGSLNVCMNGDNNYEPTEGGKDPLVCDVTYYARRVGLDIEEYKVQTEDGFIIDLWHIYNPKEYQRRPEQCRSHRSPTTFPNNHRPGSASSRKDCKYPILLVHGLLQSAGAYCTNDEDSLAFYLAKAGYDVWLGNNRCGFRPSHTLLQSNDPRMWNWNIRQMGVLDLPALISRVLCETEMPRLGLVCHSQGTTEAFVALAKGQRPDLGRKISVFCALAPAVYAGPLISKMYLKFMRVISPGMFRIMFGIHSFIPFMMTMHRLLPGKLYGAMGYRVFSFLFNWSDDRWDLGLRDRMFQFAPVYVSAESMRWWLGRECFATQKCILATREEGQQEDREDEDAGLGVNDDALMRYPKHSTEKVSPLHDSQLHDKENTEERKRRAWYDEQVPPFALWIAGSDQLVDGRRLLRRFQRGREPHVRLVYAKIIEEYEHLDVLWAMDAVEKVAKEVKEVIWKNVHAEDRKLCIIPDGCGDLHR